MNFPEILALSLVAAYLLLIIGISIYRKIKHKPSLFRDCSCPSKGKDLVADFHKMKEQEGQNSSKRRDKE